MKEIKISVKLKAVKLFLCGDTFDEIAKQLGIAKGSVVNIIDDFRNGLLPLPFGMAEYVDELRRLVVDLKKHQTTIAAVKPCLKLHARMKEMGVDDDPGIDATLTFPGFSAQKVVGIDVLNGFEQELVTNTEDGNLVIRNLLVKDYPIILQLSP